MSPAVDDDANINETISKCVTMVTCTCTCPLVNRGVKCIGGEWPV